MFIDLKAEDFSDLDIKEALDIKREVRKALKEKHPNLSFEILLLWWLLVGPIEA